MEHTEPTEETRRQIIEETKRALKGSRNPEEQGANLRTLLENLPIIQPDAPVLRDLPSEKAARWNTAEVVDYLTSQAWAIDCPEVSAGLESIADELEVLIITYAMHVFSYTLVQVRVSVARTADDAFLCWRHISDQGSGPNGGRYESLGSVRESPERRLKGSQEPYGGQPKRGRSKLRP
jgi:hypothetical protein